MSRKHNPKLTDYAKSLRKSMTCEECKLWYDFLKDYPVRFLRQKVVDNYIDDFYCNKARLVIELDGSQHYEEKRILYDRIRTERIESRNIEVVRIPNWDVNSNFDDLCEMIDMIVQKNLLLYFGEESLHRKRRSPSL